jgi:hypothetical protein
MAWPFLVFAKRRLLTAALVGFTLVGTIQPSLAQVIVHQKNGTFTAG